MSAPLRVLVVEDSITVRKHIVDVLVASGGVEVVGEAPDGKAAIRLCQQLKPDVITMDMMLPIMTGVSATEYIMAYCPTPILIVSASTNRGELFKTYDALAAGAIDVLEKPLGIESDTDWEQRLVAAVRMVARIRAIRHPRARLGRLGQSRPSSTENRVPVSAGTRVVAFGASTGGPNALLNVLRGLPAAFPLPILVVLHISEPFAPALAEWLDTQLPLQVRYAIDGEPLPVHGCVVMAPPNRHLELSHGRLKLTQGDERHSCRPSVDVLFESIALDRGAGSVACLLTGMGRDGAQGLLAIRQQGGITVAQDEATSVVFGMPAEAIKLNSAMHVLPLGDIPSLLHRVAWGREEVFP